MNDNEQAYKLFKKAYTLNAKALLLNNLAFYCYKLDVSSKAIE
jgi:hypothetical protein